MEIDEILGILIFKKDIFTANSEEIFDVIFPPGNLYI